MIKQLIDKFYLVKDPVKYWRKKGAKIGKGCEIYSSVSFGSEPYLITIGDHVRMTSKVSLVTHDGGVWVLREMNKELADVDKFGKITIGNNVHIGIGAVVMPGVSIGNNCIIGVGAVVTHDIPDNSIAVGVPARVIKTVDEYADQHKNEFWNTKHMTAEQKKAYLLENIDKI